MGELTQKHGKIALINTKAQKWAYLLELKMKKEIKIQVPRNLDFAELGLWHDDATGKITFSQSVILKLAEHNGISSDLLTLDNVSGLIVAWYFNHVENGGDKDLAAEKMIAAVVGGLEAKEYPVITLRGLAVIPPAPEDIKKIRERVGSQRFCADLVGVDTRTWERYEYLGDDPRQQRSPNPQTWGLFLLATGQHPDFTVNSRAVNA